MAGQGPIERAFAESIKIAPVAGQDVAGAALARRYAQLLDGVRGAETEAEVYRDLGPKFQAVLTALGLTLAGRAPVTKGGGVSGGTPAGTALDALRAEHGSGARANRGANLHAVSD